MAGEPMQNTSEMVPRTPTISIIILKVQHPSCFVVCYVQLVTQQYESKTVRKAPLQSKYRHYEKYRRFPLRREAIMSYRQIDTFCCLQG